MKDREIKLEIQAMVRACVNRAGLRVPKGTICSNCGVRWALVFDHRYYSQPYRVTPVCRSCNIKMGPAFDLPSLIAAWKKLYK